VQINDKIHRLCVFLMIWEITILAVVVMLSNNAFAGTLNNQTLYEAVKQTSGSEKNSQINVGGDSPTAVGVNQETSTVYVANEGSDGISVIDSIANKVVAGVTFQVNPFNSGYIVCRSSSDGLTTPSPLGQYTFVYSGDKCTAKPNEGFEFSRWEENLEGNATRLISISRSSTPLDSFLEFLNIKSHDKPEATLNITKFGTFTANFKELPPSVPQEFWVQSYVLVGTVIAGLSIPTIIGWIRSKRDTGKLSYYHKQIASLYGDGKLDENDIEPLDRLRSNIVDAYSKGKLNEKHYETLKNGISVLYEKIFRKKIDDAANKNSADKKAIQEQIVQIRNEVELAYSKGKINEKHYDLLNKAISKQDGKDNLSP
jgi:YVTN family beta-propeller protein